MKIFTQSSTCAAKEAARTQSPIKVCMYVRGTAGTDVRVMREATALLAAGFDVSIVDVSHERPQLVEEDIAGVHVRHTFSSNSFISQHFKLWPVIKTLQSHMYSVYQLMRIAADIYHAHDVQALPACYIAALLRRKPLILDSHELPLDSCDTSRWRHFTKLLARFLAIVVPHCAGVITVSSPIAQEIRNHYHASDVSVIRNVPAYQQPPKSDHLRQYLGLNPEIRIALYQGYIQPVRQLDTLVRAATFLEQNIVIVLMGKVTGETASELEALAIKEGVADRIKIIPPVPYAELLEWTASADIGFVVYSPDYSLNFQMCLPNKLFEYLMAGLPVLASQLDAVAEVIRTYDVGQIVPSLVPADVGSAINAMLADPIALARMQRNALEAAQRVLCWEKEQQQLIHLYQVILARE